MVAGAESNQSFGTDFNGRWSRWGGGRWYVESLCMKSIRANDLWSYVEGGRR